MKRTLAVASLERHVCGSFSLSQAVVQVEKTCSLLVLEDMPLKCLSLPSLPSHHYMYESFVKSWFRRSLLGPECQRLVWKESIHPRCTRGIVRRCRAQYQRDCETTDLFPCRSRPLREHGSLLSSVHHRMKVRNMASCGSGYFLRPFDHCFERQKGPLDLLVSRTDEQRGLPAMFPDCA
jgi:hypothetical protein